MRATADSTVPIVVTVLVTVSVLSACGRQADSDGTTPARPWAVGEGAALADGYLRAFESSGGEGGIGRPTTGVERWAFGCRQLFAGGRSETAVLLQQPCGRNEQVFAVTDDFWRLYQRAGELAPTVYGFPIGPAGEWKGGRTQGFGRGGRFEAFFMQRPGGGEPHVLRSPVLERYLSFDDRDVRFGYPTSAEWVADGGRHCQQFELAVLTADGAGAPARFEAVSTTSSSRAACQ